MKAIRWDYKDEPMKIIDFSVYGSADDIQVSKIAVEDLMGNEVTDDAILESAVDYLYERYQDLLYEVYIDQKCADADFYSLDD